ncbi:MAG: hypothetical protein NXI22_17240 [bacterium]|nr:hypothetical protein [bacterium]
MANYNVITPPKKPKPKRSWLWPLLIVGGLFLASVGSFFVLVVFCVIAASPYTKGSPELAARWRDEMRMWDSPDDATNESTVMLYQFANEDWAIVKAKNCHGGRWSGGGTVVIKDSKGRLSVLNNGHVCGDGNLLIEANHANLDSFYAALTEADFRELVIDECVSPHIGGDSGGKTATRK